MRHPCLVLLLGTAGAFSAAACQAQATVATAQRNISLQAGLGFTVANPDYADAYDRGLSVFAAADLPHHIGVEFEYHDADVVTPRDVGEISYLGGVRYRIPHGRYQLYVKALAGVGQVKFDKGYFPVAQSVTNAVFGFGGGLEIIASRHVIVRAADFELQKWPSFTPHSLTPYLITSGVAYRF